jgi:hypothetical protein
MTGAGTENYWAVNARNIVGHREFPEDQEKSRMAGISKM